MVNVPALNHLVERRLAVNTQHFAAVPNFRPLDSGAAVRSFEVRNLHPVPLKWELAARTQSPYGLVALPHLADWAVVLREFVRICALANGGSNS